MAEIGRVTLTGPQDNIHGMMWVDAEGEPFLCASVARKVFRFPRKNPPEITLVAYDQPTADGVIVKRVDNVWRACGGDDKLLPDEFRYSFTWIARFWLQEHAEKYKRIYVEMHYE